MFSLDISLATTDLMERQHQKDFSEVLKKTKKNTPELGFFERLFFRIGRFFRFFVKGVGSFLIRLLMAGISLWITSDFITHFLFRAEIEQSLQQKQNFLVEAKKESLELQRDEKISYFEKRYQQIIEKRDAESRTGVGDRTKIFGSVKNQRVLV